MDARLTVAAAAGFGAALLAATGCGAGGQTAPKAAAACAGDNGGITLPPGFCATVFADNLGNVRHIAVAPNGVVYANTWSGSYYPRSTPAADGFLVALQDTDKDGKADKISRFGETVADGSHGGTGVGFYKGYVYAEVNDKIVRYALPAGGVVPTR